MLSLPMTPRFLEYCSQKAAAALRARIPGYETVAEAPDATRRLVEIGNPWTRALFDGAFFRSPHGADALPAVSLVFVESRDGNTVAEDPSTLGGGETDKHVVYEGLSRVDADAVVAGAATAAGNDLVFSVWHPELVQLRQARGRARHPAQVILTERGDLPVHRALLYNEPSLRVIVITGTAGAAGLARRLDARPWVEVIDAGTPVDLRRGLRALHARGIETVSAVGGRRAARALIATGAVCELYLTTGNRAGGEGGTRLFEGPLPPCHLVLEKRGRDAERGVRFQHLLFTA